MSEVFTVQLDVTREIRWTFGAEARLGSLPRPPVLGDFLKDRKAFFALCAYVWAALGKDCPFESPEDVAAYIDTPEKVGAASKAFFQAYKAATPKTGAVPKN